MFFKSKELKRRRKGLFATPIFHKKNAADFRKSQRRLVFEAASLLMVNNISALT